MTTTEGLMVLVNKGLEYYEIIPTNVCMGEDGKLIEGTDIVGYACVNKVTHVVEHTSTILPGVLFQAQHFDNTLRSLTEPEPELEGTASEDVIPMLQ